MQRIDKWSQIAVRLRRRKQRTPDSESRDRIVGFGLREEALRFRDLRHARETARVARARLSASVAAFSSTGVLRAMSVAAVTSACARARSVVTF